MLTKRVLVKTSLAVFLLVAGASGAIAAVASKPFEAVIESYSSGTPTKTHIWNDGKGHQRSETSISGINSISISDFPNKMIYAINDQARTITTMSMNATNNDQDPSIKWTPIGAKVIDGHPCQGKRGTVGGAQVEMWEGTDIGFSVLVVTNGKPTQKLLSWKPYTPNPSLFSLPAGYQKIDMNALMKGMPQGR